MLKFRNPFKKRHSRKSLVSLLKKRQESASVVTPDSHGSSLHVESYFLHLYQLECKRSERTKSPFLLMLIDISCLSCIGAARFLVPVEEQLLINKREYDIIGWYKTGRIIGILFSDFNHEKPGDMAKRITDSFRGSLGNAPTGLLSVTLFKVTGTIRERIQLEQKHGDPCPPDNSLHLYPESLQKRAVDIAGALFGITVFAPAFLVVALVVRLTSKGPVLFRQERVGKDHKPFRMLKFRSMYVDNNDAIHRDYIAKLIKGEIEGEATETGEKIFKIRKDPRITPIGHFIRKTSLDEIPQFFNVLKGDMSLVGPRPAIKYEVDQYDIWHCRRVSTKPGITGFWQVKGRSLTTFDGMVRMDIRYIQRGSLLSDIILILRTPFVLISSKGAC